MTSKNRLDSFDTSKLVSTMKKYDHHFSVPAVVLDADTLASAAAIQSLGRKKISVTAISEDPDALGFSSKYVKRKHVSSVAPRNYGFIEYLLRRKERGVLFFFKDATAELLSKYHEDLEADGYTISITPYDIQRKLYDKNALFGIAQEYGVAYPKSVLIEQEHDLLQASETLTYPYILKPTKGTSGLYYLIKDRSIDAAATFRRLNRFITSDSYLHADSRIIAQEFIGAGNLTLWNYNALFKEGEPVAEFTGLRIRSNMKKDGTVGSTLLHGRSKDNAVLVSLNRKLLSALSYEGPVETEWGYDEGLQRYTLFDVNTRPSGNIRWAIAAGVNIPYLYYLYSLNNSVNPPVQEEDITYHKMLWFSTDLLDAVRRWVHGISNGWFDTIFRDRLRVTDIAAGAMCSIDFSNVPIWRIMGSNAKALFTPGKSAIDVLDFRDVGPTVKILRTLISVTTKRILGK